MPPPTPSKSVGLPFYRQLRAEPRIRGGPRTPKRISGTAFTTHLHNIGFMKYVWGCVCVRVCLCAPGGCFDVDADAKIWGETTPHCNAHTHTTQCIALESWVCVCRDFCVTFFFRFRPGIVSSRWTDQMVKSSLERRTPSAVSSYWWVRRAYGLASRRESGFRLKTGKRLNLWICGGGNERRLECTLDNVRGFFVC